MREIGSEFWDIPVCGTEHRIFPERTQWFLSGRDALSAIIRDILRRKKVLTAAIPSWCCDSMIVPFLKEGIRPCFYPVTASKEFTQDISQVMGCDVLLVMDYFGYSNSPVPKGFQGIIIRDLTHSVFSLNRQFADYSFGSLRKWCGFWSGGFAWAYDGHMTAASTEENQEYISLRKKAMEMKASYLTGKNDENSGECEDKRYLEIFHKAEELLESYGAAAASRRDVRLAASLDVDFIRTRRRDNAEILRRAFAEQLIFPELADEDCPLFVPIKVPQGKRNALRQYLNTRKIYCPVHWPVSEYHVLDAQTAELYEDELSLVCDQRYTADDMYRIVGAVKDFGGGELS